MSKIKRVKEKIEYRVSFTNEEVIEALNKCFGTKIPEDARIYKGVGYPKLNIYWRNKKD